MDEWSLKDYKYINLMEFIQIGTIKTANKNWKHAKKHKTQFLNAVIPEILINLINSNSV